MIVAIANTVMPTLRAIMITKERITIALAVMELAVLSARSNYA